MWAERQQVTEARAVKQMEQPDAVSPAEAKPDAKALLEIAGANAAPTCQCYSGRRRAEKPFPMRNLFRPELPFLPAAAAVPPLFAYRLPLA